MKKIEIELNDDIKKKLIMTSIILGISILILILAFYIGNEQFKSFFDRNILRREIAQNNVSSIKIKEEESPNIYAYDKYIVILNKNKLTTYTVSGKKEYEQEISINNAIFSSKNRYLVVAEKKGKKIYVILDGNILWQNEVEGEIKDVQINQNGYVSISISGTSYKTVVATYNPAGKEMFKTYLSNTTAIDTSISQNNKYLGIAEVNVSGSLIQSSVKIISIEKAQNDPANSVIYTYQATSNDLIKDIEYQDKDKLICIYNSGISILENEQNEQIVTFSKDKIRSASIKLNNYVIYTVEKNSGIFSTNTQVLLRNVHNKKENIYTIKGNVKNIYTYGNNIALNLGTEVHFIGTNGWLLKKYVSQQEIKDIVLGENIAGILYKNRIEIINL
ncbi:MAG: hypothetical protein HFJ53_08620 [Clostridia bacterium]|jgi:hypothetical protein|nr:hypothetical protein [Clostridia bacterium]